MGAAGGTLAFLKGFGTVAMNDVAQLNAAPVYHTVAGWLIGYGVVALLVGSYLTWKLWDVLHAYFHRVKKARGWSIEEDLTERLVLYPFLVGVFERTIFTVLIAFQVPGVGGGLMAWIGIKMVSGWNRISKGGTAERMLAFTGLLCSLTSLTFAVLGGLIANGQIPVYRLFR